MKTVDVLFPQNIEPLSYSVPEELAEAVRPGALVTAEIRKSPKAGIVIGPALSAPKGELKPVAEVVRPDALGEPMRNLIKWIAEYYVCSQGLALKSAMAREFFEPVGQRASKKVREPQAAYHAAELGHAAAAGLGAVLASAERPYYKSFLHLAPSVAQEHAFALAAAGRASGGAIVVAPDMAVVEYLAPAFKDALGDRLALYHSAMSKGARTEAISRMMSGEADVVLGGMMAVFAPMPSVRLICVLHEESTLYKAEGTPRYNARDVAVMRSYLEGATCVLSSICPSVESWHNAATGKYTLIDSSADLGRSKRPKVRIVSLHESKGVITKTLREETARAIASGHRAMVYVNRKGHSMLSCDECGEMVQCKACKIPLVHHKAAGELRCAYCGMSMKPPRTCGKCKGHSLRPTGAGMERALEELAALEPTSVETKGKTRSLDIVMDSESGLAVGTRTITRADMLSCGFSVAGIANADSHLFMPDFRARERAMQDFMYTAGMVGSGGQVIVQTRQPGLPLYQQFRAFNLRRFYEDELAMRVEAGYPPMSRLAVITISTSEAPALTTGRIKGVDVIGPVQAHAAGKAKRWQVMLRSDSRDQLRKAVQMVVKKLGAIKHSVDIDPV